MNRAMGKSTGGNERYMSLAYVYRCGFIQYGFVQYGFVQFVFVQYGFVQYGFVQYGFVQYKIIRTIDMPYVTSTNTTVVYR